MDKMNEEEFRWGEISEGVETRAKYRKQGYDYAMDKVKEFIDTILNKERPEGYSE